jgi:hypothetical protein
MFIVQIVPGMVFTNPPHDGQFPAEAEPPGGQVPLAVTPAVVLCHCGGAGQDGLGTSRKNDRTIATSTAAEIRLSPLTIMASSFKRA